MSRRRSFLRYLSSDSRHNDYSSFEKIVRRSFKQRLKKLINNLVPDIFVDRAQAEAIFLKLGLKDNCRAEELSIDDFRRLSESLSD